MLNRLVLLVLLLFWGTMTWLLWRSEFGGGSEAGSGVPIENVWQRVLTAPDDSSLEIRRRGKKIGVCRWSANVHEDLSTGRVSSPAALEPDGRVQRVGSYTLDLDGQLNLVAGERPYKFNVHLDVSTNNAWHSFTLRLIQRPGSWEIFSSTETETVDLHVEDGGTEWDRQFTFDDLKRPEKLLAEFGAPWATPMLAAVIGSRQPTTENLSLGLKWDARQDWFQLGTAKVRAYRLSARLFDRFQVVIYLSRTGEILRAELPDEITAVNDAFLNF